MPEEMFIYDTDCTDEPMFDRGFTGYEHLYAFGLINMNGRMYDPQMSSFLSPDNYVQCPDNPQNFNRYAYCLNNPLRYTDPSGEVFTELLIGAAIGAAVNLSVQGLAGKITDVGDFVAAMGVGALAGLVGGAIGSGISSAIAGTGFGCGLIGAGSTATTSFASGAAIGAGAGFSGGFITGCGNAWINGASFGDGLVSGLKSGLVGGLTGGLVGGVSGGISAAMDGRNFWNGDKVIVAERKYPVGSDYMQPENSFDCVPTNAKVINNYHSGDKTARYMRDTYWIKGSDPMESGVVSDEFYMNLSVSERVDFEYWESNFTEENVFDYFNNCNADIAFDIPGKDGYHNVILRKMECRIHRTWGNGAHDITFYRSWIQDPATGYVNSNIFDFSLVKKICLLYY